jgi:hypothetical protein
MLTSVLGRRETMLLRHTVCWTSKRTKHQVKADAQRLVSHLAQPLEISLQVSSPPLQPGSGLLQYLQAFQQSSLYLGLLSFRFQQAASPKARRRFSSALWTGLAIGGFLITVGLIAVLFALTQGNMVG